MMGLTVLLLRQYVVEAVFWRVVSAVCAFTTTSGWLLILTYLWAMPLQMLAGAAHTGCPSQTCWHQACLLRRAEQGRDTHDCGGANAKYAVAGLAFRSCMLLPE